MWKVRVQKSQFLCDGFATLQVHKFNLHTKIIRYLITPQNSAQRMHPSHPRPIIATVLLGLDPMHRSAASLTLLSPSPQLRLFSGTNVVAHSARLHCCVEGSIPNFLLCGANDMPYRAIFGARELSFSSLAKILPLDSGNEGIGQGSFTNHFPRIGIIMVLSPHDWQAGDHGNAHSPGK